MIFSHETFHKFGYRTETLAKQSHKDICMACDYCNKEYISTMKRITLGRTHITKDACIKCRYKKRADLSMLKHGVKNSAQVPEVREKIRASNIDRLQSDANKEKIRQTNLRKFGHESAMQCKEVQQKQKDVIKEKYGVDNPIHIPGVAKRASEKMIQTKIDRGQIKLYEGKTMPSVAKDVGFSRSHFGKLIRKHGLDEALLMTSQQSQLEMIFEKWLKEEKIEYKKQFRVGGRIADFKINNLLIELDGLYWHSENGNKDRNYHKNKRKTYLDNNYDVMFFREDELMNKFGVIKSLINNRLHRSTERVFARKCILERDTDKQFFTDNHLMGKGYGPTFSLLNNNQIVASMQIRRLNQKHYEISRFCTKNGVSVIGGFSRLLNCVEGNLDIDSLKTFIDLRYGYGDYLTKFGFVRGKAYLSFKWTNGKDLVHRLKFPGNSGHDKGFSKIWDCGQLPFIKSVV